MLSWPKLGPIVFSSTGTIDAASEPSRSKSARSCASNGESPSITNLFENTPWIVATVIAAVELLDDLLGAREVGGLDDRDLQQRSFRVRRVGDDAHVVADLRLAQLRAQIRLVRRQVLADRLVQVDLIEEMHAAAQVEAE